MNSLPHDMGIERLTLQERLDLIAIIWDGMAAKPDALPLPDWHREELERRLATADADPAAGAPWSEVLERMRDPS